MSAKTHWLEDPAGTMGAVPRAVASVGTLIGSKAPYRRPLGTQTCAYRYPSTRSSVTRGPAR